MATFRGSIVSRDGKSVALYLIKARGFGGRALHDAVESVDALPWDDAVVRVVGTEYMIDQMGDLLGSNFRSILLVEFFALLLVTPLFMRSLRRAYLPFAAALGDAEVDSAG